MHLSCEIMLNKEHAYLWGGFDNLDDCNYQGICSEVCACIFEYTINKRYYFNGYIYSIV